MLFLLAFAAILTINHAVTLKDWDEEGEEKKDPMEEARLERLNGTLTKLSGFNYNDDSSVTKINIAGNAALDESYLKDVFKRYYTHRKKKGHEHEKILEKDWAQRASREIIKTWNKSNDEETEKFLTAQFEPAWEHFDVNSDGYITPDKSYVFARMLIGSFSKSFSDE